MRRFRGNKRRFNTINITNITNITQVVAGHGHRPAGKRRGDIGERRTERPPKLLRFCGSCGVMDQDVASRMSSSELCDESVKVIGYASKGLCRSTERSIRSH